MLKVYTIFLVNCLIISAYSKSLEKESEAKIITNEFTIDEKGNYNFSFETSNGITRDETGTIQNAGLANEFIKVSGSYTYINSDGFREVIQYTADENGYIVLPFDDVVLEALPGPVIATLLG